jgi:beta-glucosidase
VVTLGKPVVLVLLNSRPLSIAWAAEHVSAILEAWEPGNEGGHAIADILFGDANPGGKLPVTFPRQASHAPSSSARNSTHMPESSPLFPFGFGLSYSTFSFTNLKVSEEQVKVGQTVEVGVEVTNSSRFTVGDVVAQLYLYQKYGSDARPMRELNSFERMTLQPTETKTVTFHLGPNELEYWSTSEGRRVQDAAAFELWVGADSLASLHADRQVVSEEREGTGIQTQ